MYILYIFNISVKRHVTCMSPLSWVLIQKWRLSLRVAGKAPCPGVVCVTLPVSHGTGARAVTATAWNQELTPHTTRGAAAVPLLTKHKP